MCLALSLAVGPAGLRPVGAASREAELDELRQAIEESRDRVTAFERRERELLDVLEEVDRALDALRAEVADARARAAEARAELQRLEARREELERRLSATRRAMSRRAVALYKAGEVGPVRAVFAATSLRELLGRVSSLQTLLEHDRDLVARFRAESRDLASTLREAEQAADLLEQALERLASRRRDLAAESRLKRQVLARVHEDRTRERALLNEMETAARALEETLAGMAEPGRRESGPAGSSFAGFEGRRGSLAFPVDAPVARGFGRVVDREFLTETFRKGVEFDAPLGDAVRATAPGSVRYAGWFRGYGKIVILDHGESWFTVSGHLDGVQVEVGDTVGEGDVIGTVGETGSLAGPQLYFEIRRGGEPLDPAEWLQGARTR